WLGVPSPSTWRARRASGLCRHSFVCRLHFHPPPLPSSSTSIPISSLPASFPPLLHPTKKRKKGKKIPPISFTKPTIAQGRIAAASLQWGVRPDPDPHTPCVKGAQGPVLQSRRTDRSLFSPWCHVECACLKGCSL